MTRVLFSGVLGPRLLIVCALVAHSAYVALAAPATMACDVWTGQQYCSTLASGVKQLITNAYGGGAMQIKQHYLTGQFSIDIKLQPGNTGGTAVSFYLADSVTPNNKDPNHSEIDIQFLGNLTASNVLFATNVYNAGKQKLAQFRLNFDPSAAFHNYAIKWNNKQIVWLIDQIPIRILKRAPGQPWPEFAMNPQASLYSTPWSALKANFAGGPIKVWMKNFVAAGCPAMNTDKEDVTQPVHCQGTWNLPLTPAQTAGYAKLHKATFLVEYEWDLA